jgi:hypothetical protein
MDNVRLCKRNGTENTLGKTVEAFPGFYLLLPPFDFC